MVALRSLRAELGKVTAPAISEELQGLDALAAFAGVPKAALNTAKPHGNRGTRKIPLVAALPDLPDLLEQNGLGQDPAASGY